MSGPLRVVVVYPDLLGTYGDGGNGLILARRAEWRGRDVELLPAPSDRPLPEADLYCLGGGEDGPQVRAARTLIDDGTLAKRVADGAVVLAVCAGFQIVGRTFPGAAGDAHEGLGLLGIDTTKGTGPRAVGEVLVDPTGVEHLPALTGFENHGGVTALAEGAVPLGRVTAGVGNGDGERGGGPGPGRRDLHARSGAGAQPGAGRRAAVLGARRRRARTTGRLGSRAPARGATGQRGGQAAPARAPAQVEDGRRREGSRACR